MRRAYKISKKWKGIYGETIFFDGKIEVDDVVINQVDDEWRTIFYPSLTSPQKVAEHIAFNIIVNDLTLSGLDGFADLTDDMVKILEEK